MVFRFKFALLKVISYMRKIFILTLILCLSNAISYGQRSHRHRYHSNNTGLFRELFINPLGGGFSVKSVEYAYYPFVNQSSVRLNWRSARFTHSRPVLSNELQVDLFALTWMFPNSLKKSWGSIGTSIVTFTYRFGEGRLKPFVTGEFLGISTCNELLGEKLIIEEIGKERLFIIYSGVSAGLDCYLGKHTMLKASAGVMDRCIIKGNYLYPYGSVSLVYEINLGDDIYRSSFRLNN